MHHRRRLPSAPPAASVVVTACLGLAMIACGAPAAETSGQADPEPAAPAVAALADLQVVDLTHPLGEDSLYWPTGFPFEYERLTWGESEAGDWYAAGSFTTAEHLGTHLDAPIHFAADRWTVDAIPAGRLVGPAAVVDIRERAATDSDATLQPADLEAWEQAHGPLPAGAVVLVRTGWSSRWPDWNRYYGSDTPFEPDTLHFPGVSPEAAEVLVARGVAGVGIDTASIDPGNDLDFRAHRVLAAGNVYNLENLTGLEALPPAGAVIVAAATKIAGGSGGPARVLALVPGE